MCNVNVVDEKSRKVQNVNTNIQDECVSLLKSRAQLAQMEDDDDNVFATSLIAGMLQGQMNYKTCV